jgi:hypothetical protein
MPRLINAIERRCKVRWARKRYLDGVTGSSKGPHGVLYLAGAEMPPGVQETAWLGEQIEQFRHSVSVYRGDLLDA